MGRQGNPTGSQGEQYESKRCEHRERACGFHLQSSSAIDEPYLLRAPAARAVWVAVVNELLSRAA